MEPGVSNVEIEMWNGRKRENGAMWSWGIGLVVAETGRRGREFYRVLGEFYRVLMVGR